MALPILALGASKHARFSDRAEFPAVSRLSTAEMWPSNEADRVGAPERISRLNSQACFCPHPPTLRLAPYGARRMTGVVVVSYSFDAWDFHPLLPSRF